ncbi:MAG TPA: LCP family protein [Promicromonospora sp.]|nr:LCP family protein [Promicromonospora sp.]
MHAPQVVDDPRPTTEPGPEPGPATRHARPPHGGRRPDKRRRGRVALAVVAGALVLVVGAGALAWAGYTSALDRKIERIEDPFAALDEADRPDPAPAPAQGEAAPLNILALGSDSRISAGDPSQWEFGAQRTDAIILLHVSADRTSAAAISIPRDSWVDVPGYGKAKINAAFSYGGPALMIETVENLTGVRIDHFAVADFESFTTLTDTLGGVEIEVPREGGGSELRTMSGEEALEFTRERYSLPNGDFGRVQRQQAWLRAIAGKATREVRDVGTATRFLETALGSLSVDEGFGFDEMLGLAVSSRELSPADIAFLTAPYAGTDRSADGQSIVVLDEPRLAELMGAVAEDRLPEYLENAPDGLDQLPPVVR